MVRSIRAPQGSSSLALTGHVLPVQRGTVHRDDLTAQVGSARV